MRSRPLRQYAKRESRRFLIGALLSGSRISPPSYFAVSLSKTSLRSSLKTSTSPRGATQIYRCEYCTLHVTLPLLGALRRTRWSSRASEPVFLGQVYWHNRQEGRRGAHLPGGRNNAFHETAVVTINH